MTKAWKQRKRQAFLEPKAHLPVSSRDGSLNLHFSGVKSMEPPGFGEGI